MLQDWYFGVQSRFQQYSTTANSPDHVYSVFYAHNLLPVHPAANTDFLASLTEKRLIGVLTPCSTMFQSYQNSQFTNACLSSLSHTSNTHNNIYKQLTAFPHILLAHWRKTNDNCDNVFCQTTEIMSAELGFQLTTPWLTVHVATDWATGAPNDRRMVTFINPRKEQLAYIGFEVAFLWSTAPL